MKDGIYEIDDKYSLTRVADNAGQFATAEWQQNWADKFQRKLVLRENGRTVVIAEPSTQAVANA